ncbi:MAG: hypothetical protein ACREA1_07995 [Nitrosotalea sp.]
MWKQQKKSFKIKIAILLVLSVSFMPVSYLWFNTLSDLDCKQSDQNHVMMDLNDKQHTCVYKTGLHWAVFYGINALIYGVPFTLILKSERNRFANL